MSFSVTARGPKFQVLDSLRALEAKDLGQDGLGQDLVDVVVNFIEAGSDPGPSQVYTVALSGHSGEGSPVTLTASVQLENATPAQAAEMAQKAQDDEPEEPEPAGEPAETTEETQPASTAS
jgi:hypothetical protein